MKSTENKDLEADPKIYGLTHDDRTQIINEWQLCPKCNGTGLVWNTNWPYSETVFSSGPVGCDLCNGKKIISKINGLPPQ